MKRHIKIGLTVGLGIVILLVGLGFYISRRIDQGFEDLNQAKAARRTTATVLRKEYIKFDQANHSFVGNLGDVIEMAPGTEHWRVYYRINNFDQVPEPKRSALVSSETKRIATYGNRFHYWGPEGKDIYASVKEGDTLVVTYRYIGDEKEIINVDTQSNKPLQLTAR